jgi:hypothetical protein
MKVEIAAMLNLRAEQINFPDGVIRHLCKPRLSFPRRRESSTLRLLGSITAVSGILDPRLRGDDDRM